ncbi:MAG: phosphonoacetaldehyde hydrolase [Oscillospiraceae bacterium]|jgi:phosphonoacetaldehyde hydrolase|nr:phosphonoacetaldehyde hydrolase [Oscillospiraceae bacterium]
MSKIKTLILDWAGTAIDFGCFAPVDAFAAAFETFGIVPTIRETRAPMGLAKRAHIAKMLDGERLSALWRKKYGTAHTAEDIDKIYARFEPALFAVLNKYAEPLPGVLETVREIRSLGISIGSTTGYTRAMMNVVAPLAAQNGYAPDCLVCPEDVGGLGRPYPYMLWRNLEKLGTLSICEVIKVGDTAADMEEGKNAGCLCVGVIKGSCMLGLDDDKFARLSEAERIDKFSEAERRYTDAGADFVLHDITELPNLIHQLNDGRTI